MVVVFYCFRDADFNLFNDSFMIVRNVNDAKIIDIIFIDEDFLNNFLC